MFREEVILLTLFLHILGWYFNFFRFLKKKILRRGFQGALERNFHCTNDEKSPVLKFFQGRKKTALEIARTDLDIHVMEIHLGNVLTRTIL
jgi:hypothetical protein